MMRSLRARLLLLLCSAVLLAWLATAIFSYLDARHEIGELMDAQLAHAAELVAGRIDHEAEGQTAREGHRARGERHGRPDAENFTFQVWNPEGRLMFRSDNAPTRRLSEASEGYADVRIDGQSWRVFGRLDPSSRYLVQVAQRADLREELAESVASHLMHPLVVAVPVLAVLIWVAVSGGLRPLARVASEVALRAPGNLAPIKCQGAPREIEPLLDALNALFTRVENSLEQERRFTADAAHELRTPLAAIKTQAQVALGARNDEERQRTLANVVRGADRAARLAEQLLVLSRLDPQSAAPQLKRIDLAEAARDAVAEMAPMAAARGSTLALAAEAVTVDAEPTLIGVLLRNLVDNALRYSPPGSTIEVAVKAAGDQGHLRVTDNGPGIPAEAREQVLERFHRLLGTGEEGSGLGLSIVKRIAELHGARLELGEGAGGGLAVTLAFLRFP